MVRQYYSDAVIQGLKELYKARLLDHNLNTWCSSNDQPPALSTTLTSHFWKKDKFFASVFLVRKARAGQIIIGC